ncbi:hypothetical protein EJB05_56332 [Eragrostis curvula]|uniref:Uncharacterized protein n=1 Tax=Eragrostis curvula TaxID=38414 RepID=A0A5J9SGG0_9POAL|nr:hypothetical protein EJB05_56332 [Eragrostis curvula]
MRPVLICRSPPTPFQIEDQPSTSNQLLRSCHSQPDPAVPKQGQPDAATLTSMEKTYVAPYSNGKNCRNVFQLKVNSKASMDAIHFRLKSLFPESVVMYLLEESCKHSLGIL